MKHARNRNEHCEGCVCGQRAELQRQLMVLREQIAASERARALQFEREVAESAEKAGL